MTKTVAYLGPGSNLGDRMAALERARALFYGDGRHDAPGLSIPDPRLHERRFVLVPLAEIGPALRHPVLGLTVAEMCARCGDTSEVSLYDRAEVGA